jgi:hypothetical protein
MIVRKKWSKKSHGGLRETFYDGYYLFGFIPLYIQKKILDK